MSAADSSLPEVSSTTLFATELVLSTLSILGASFVLATCLILKELRRHPTKLIVYLSLCNLCFSLKYWISAVISLAWHEEEGNTQNHTVCLFQAYWGQFWGMGCISWNGIISLNLIISMTKPFYNTAQLTKFYHLYVWGSCILSTLAVFVREDIGPSGDGTCWIASPKDPTRLIFYLPLFVYFILSVAAVVTARFRFKTMVALTKTKKSQAIRRLVFYVAVFIVCWAGPVAHKLAPFITSVPGTENPSILVLVDGMGESMQGFANSVVWLANPKFFVKLKYVLMYTIFRCCVDDSRMPLVKKNINESTSGYYPYVDVPSSYADMSKLVAPESMSQTYTNSINADTQSNNLLILVDDDGPSPGSRSGSQKYGNAEPDKVQPSNKHVTNWITSLEEVLRESAIMCFIMGIHKSVRAYSEVSTTGLKNEDFEQVAHYTKDELSSHLPVDRSFTFIDLFPSVFAAIRHQSNIYCDDYIASWDVPAILAKLQTSKQFTKTGKSGSFFVFSSNNRFLLKTMTEEEFTVLKNILPALYQHLSENENSLIARIYGAHALSTGDENKLYVMILENIFHGQQIHESYDIKGSWINRTTQKNEDRSKMGKDNDFDANKRILKLSDGERASFITQIVKDAQFLTTLGIMDYSLLVGFHFLNPETSPLIDGEEPVVYIKRNGVWSVDRAEKYYFGLIDILQMYDMKKKAEVFYKAMVLGKEKEGISAAPPHFYCERFISKIKAITRLEPEEQSSSSTTEPS